MFYLMDKSEHFSLEDKLSDHSEGLLPRGQGEVRIYKTFATKILVIRTPKDYCSMFCNNLNRKRIWKKIDTCTCTKKENQTFQVKEFCTFLCMERCKSLGSLKSFLAYAP